MAKEKKEDIASQDIPPSLRERRKLETDKLIPTGSTLLNLACSDNPDGGFLKGTMDNIVGDSSSGKSVLALTMLADCANRPEFDKYELIYDDVECANAFDMPYIFGSLAASRIREDIHSTTVEELRSNMVKLIGEGKPFIYIVDSFDALSSDAEEARAVKAAKSGESQGTYGADKQKMGGEIMRLCLADIAKTDSLFVVISQAKDILQTNFFSSEKKRRAGGAWLDFYSTHILWLLNPKKITKDIKGVKRVIGSRVSGTLKKNKATGKVRPAALAIYNDFGVDDSEANIEFLLEAGIFKKAKSEGKGKGIKIENEDDNTTEISSERKGSEVVDVGGAFGLGASLSMANLIRFIEKKEGGVEELKRRVYEAYIGIEESIQMTDRKPRFR